MHTMASAEWVVQKVMLNRLVTCEEEWVVF